MADFLTSIKSVRNRKENDRPEPLLTAVTSTSTNDEAREPHRARPNTPHVDVEAVYHTQPKPRSKCNATPTSPQEALEILRSQPTQDELIDTLDSIKSKRYSPNFDINAPGPLQAQIINTILNTIVPTFWPSLKSHEQDILLTCLRNIAGLNAVIARLKFLAAPNRPRGAEIQDLLNVISRLLSGTDVLSTIWSSLQTALSDDATKRDMAWKEVVNSIGSGRVVAVVAQAEDALKSSDDTKMKAGWLSSGTEFATWLGGNIAVLARHDTEKVKDAMQVLGKALNLGYPGALLNGMIVPLVRNDAPDGRIAGSLQHLPTHSKRTFMEHILRWLTGLSTSEDMKQQSKDVSTIAGLLSTLAGDDRLRQHILSFFKDPALGSSLSFTVCRATIAVLARTSIDDLQDFLETSVSNFSSPIFINHAPLLQQESLAQLILLASGYIHRATPMALLVTARSSSHMQGVSNRLDSSNARARWLGMLVGTALSGLVDKEGSKMDFGTEEMKGKEAKWWLGVVDVDDRIGTLQHFVEFIDAQDKAVARPRRCQVKLAPMPNLNGKPVFGPARPPVPVQTEVVGEKVTELVDSHAESDDDDDYLKPHAKPDSDPEDSDEDATLVNRNKARPPVYIRDLMAMLRDEQNHDRFELGIKHAAALIRRKSNFGAEVRDHAEELGNILVALQDPFDMEGFEEMKLQALIAVLLSDVKTIGPWLSRQAFVGDYSIAQRCIMLSALGLGGRELAGFKHDDDALNPAQAQTDLPSKRLPPHFHAIYSPAQASKSTQRLEAASKDMERAMIKPLALEAADKSTAYLNAVKVRTFSSRLDASKRTKRKPAPNQLAKLFGETFFFPLANGYQQDVSAYGSASVFSGSLVPFVLVTYLKTVALLLHASGPATLDLATISAEFWDLLLSLRVKAVGDVSVLQAVLFASLTLLEVNEDKRRIAQEHPKQLMETQQWVDMVFERTGGGGLVNEAMNQDEAKVRTLAAAVLVKCREAIEVYQTGVVGYGFV